MMQEHGGALKGSTRIKIENLAVSKPPPRSMAYYYVVQQSNPAWKVSARPGEDPGKQDKADPGPVDWFWDTMSCFPV